MKFLKSRLFTVIIGAGLGAVSQINPEWGALLAAAAGAIGWAIPHPADRKGN